MLRDYQIQMLERLEQAWDGRRSVLVQMPTGTGKTVLMAEAIRRETSRTSQSSIMEYLLTDKLSWRYRVYRQELGKNPFVAASMTVRSLWFSLVKRIRYSEICTLGASESRCGFPKSD